MHFSRQNHFFSCRWRQQVRGFRENPLADNSLKFKLKNRGWREGGGYREGGSGRASLSSRGKKYVPL